MATATGDEKDSELVVPVWQDKEFGLRASVGPSYCEKWSICGSKMQISNNGNIITMTSKGYATGVGTNVVRKDEECEWQVTVNKGFKASNVPWCYIGVISKIDNENDSYLNGTVLYNNEMNIGYYSGANDYPGIYGNFDKKPKQWKSLIRYEKEKIFQFCNNQTITIKLDTTKNEIIFVQKVSKKEVKSIEVGTTEMSFKTVCKLPALTDNNGWRLYCTMYYPGDNMTIESCHHRHNTILDLNSIMQPISYCLQATCAATGLAIAPTTANDQNEVNNNDSVISNKKEDGVASLSSLSALTEIYKNLDLPMLYVLKDNIDEYLNNYKDCRQLFDRYNTRMDELNDIIENKVFPDIFKYKEWDVETVAIFILSLNKEFVIYKNDLLINFKKQNFDGKCLDNLEKNDLIQFGINDFSHRSQIHQAIKNVVNGTFKTPTKQLKQQSQQEQEKEKEKEKDIVKADSVLARDGDGGGAETGKIKGEE